MPVNLVFNWSNLKERLIFTSLVTTKCVFKWYVRKTSQLSYLICLGQEMCCAENLIHIIFLSLFIFKTIWKSSIPSNPLLHSRYSSLFGSGTNDSHSRWKIVSFLSPQVKKTLILVNQSHLNLYDLKGRWPLFPKAKPCSCVLHFFPYHLSGDRLPSPSLKLHPST